jgi:hypothetical protein
MNADVEVINVEIINAFAQVSVVEMMGEGVLGSIRATIMSV